MVLNREGINRIRNLVEADLYKGQAGTGTTVPTVSDTGLTTAVSDTANNLSTSLSDLQLTATNTITAGQGNGSSLSEAIVEMGTATTQYNLMHAIFNPLVKTATEQHIHINRFFFRNNL